jgi:hypothetical protein
MQYILLRDDSIEPHQHPCLQILPQIFLKAMKGIASQVDAFLGENIILLHSKLKFNYNHSSRPAQNKGIFQPIKWEEGIIIDNTLSMTNSQSNSSGISQRSGSGLSRSGAETNPTNSTSSNSNSVIGGVGSRNLGSANGDNVMITSEQSSPTQPLQRRLAKSFSVAPSHSHTKGCAF